MQARTSSRVLVGALLVGLAGCSTTLERYEFAEPKMGTTFRLVLFAPDEEEAGLAAAAAFARVDELNAIFSDYDATSELSRLVAAGVAGPAEVSEELFGVLSFSALISVASGGAFDVTVGPYVRLWRRAQRQGELPTAERLAEARAAVGYQHLKLHASTRAVEVTLPGTRVDLGGVAKGFAIDEALRVLADHGIVCALVDGGGDVAFGAPPPGLRGWSIAIEAREGAQPSMLMLAYGAVATSGDAFRSFEVDGVRYSHLIDPRTGLGLTRRVSATVVAPSATQADAMATAVCVLGGEEGLRFLDRQPMVEGRILTVEKGQTRVWDTPGFWRLLFWGAPEGPRPRH